MKVAPLPASSSDLGESLSLVKIGGGQSNKKNKGKGDHQEYLFLGLESAGKTLLIRRVKAHLANGSGSSKRGKRSAAITGSHFSTDVVPTIGVNVDTVKVGKKKSVKLREVGGTMKPLWPTYLKACTSLVFCMDLSQESSLVPSVVELARLLSSQDLSGKPVHLVLTKYDAPCTIDPSDLHNLTASLLLDQQHQQQEERQPQRSVDKTFVVSAYTGDGIQDLVATMINDQWSMINQCQPPPPPPPPPPPSKSLCCNVSITK